MYSKCRSSCTEKEVLVLCDTTEFNIDNQKGRIKDFTGLGATSHNSTIGFFAHSALVIDRFSNHKLGWAHINLFNRTLKNKPFVRSNSSVAIEQKESFKWQKACLESIDKVVDTAKKVWYVMDREADIYELMERVTPRANYIIRARHNRRLLNSEEESVLLIDDIKSKAVQSDVTLHINGESRGQIKRDIRCELRYYKYTIPISRKVLKKEEYAQSVEVYIIHIEQQEKTVKKGEKFLGWTLLTNEQIETSDQAMQIIEYYKKRWEIEEAFRLLKQQGFNIESSQLESGSRIRKWLLLGMDASITIMKLKTSRAGDTDLKTQEVFDEQERQCLELLNTRLQGKTEKLKNPHDKKNLAWAAWLIARLGGWDGYQSQRPPGTITFKRGLDRFYQQAMIFKLLKDSS